MSVIWKEILVISGKITDIFCFSFDFILEIPKFVAIPIRISGVFMGNTEAFIKR